MSFYYLATPYSKYPDGKQAAFEAACDQAALLLRAGLIVFSPIAHTHPIHERHAEQLGGSWETWAKFDEAMIAASRGVIVCQLPGWRESVGIAAEVELARGFGLGIAYMAPGVVPFGLVRD